MQPDLQGLEISPGELRHLSGCDPSEVFRPAKMKHRRYLLNFLFQEFLVSLALTPVLVGFLYIFVIRPMLGSSLLAALACLVVMPVAVTAGRGVWRKFTTPESLVALLDDVDRYHSTLKAVEIGDSLEAAGSSDGRARDRQTLISALQLTRTDLVRALKTERILRDNKDFIATNPELFASNLTAIEALQVSDRGSAYSKFLNDALQIGMSIQEEMRKLQESD
ncbi:MAG: hypothetical protein SWY16_03970 [Cyanobacteriota bacterium]|nr:hypothetical protein [Cyanobacteriota bacterium]